MTATARSRDGGLRHEIDVNGRHVIVTDEPERLGGTDEGPAPHELLAAMVASCVSTVITLYAQSRQWELSDIRVEVVYDPEPTPRRAHVRIYLPDGLTQGQVKRLQRVAEACPARRALEAGSSLENKSSWETPRSAQRSDPPTAPAEPVFPQAIHAVPHYGLKPQ